MPVSVNQWDLAIECTIATNDEITRMIVVCEKRMKQLLLMGHYEVLHWNDQSDS